MAPRRRRDEAPPRRWPLYALFGAAVFAGVAMWAYAPSLAPETLIARYANDRSRFVDVGGVNAHVREQGWSETVTLERLHASPADVTAILRGDISRLPLCRMRRYEAALHRK